MLAVRPDHFPQALAAPLIVPLTWALPFHVECLGFTNPLRNVDTLYEVVHRTAVPMSHSDIDDQAIEQAERWAQ